MSPLPCLESDPGIGLLWAALPGRNSSSVASAYRERALWRVCKARGAGSLLCDGQPWRELTLLRAGVMDGEALVICLQAVRSENPGSIIRAELDCTGEVALRLTRRQARRLSGDAALFFHIVIDRQDELTAGKLRQIAILADAGIPLAGEIRLQKGVNDEGHRLRDLLLLLQKNRVRPYYLIDGEWLPDELRVEPEAIDELVRGVRGWISGLAVPQAILETSGGIRRPMVPNYLRHMEPAGVDALNYQGRVFRYVNPPSKVQTPP